MTYKDMLDKLSKSKFRNSFKLKEKDINYIKEKGPLKIKEHAYDFINKRLAPAFIPNDGKQTPMRGIQYLPLNTHVPVAVVVVWKNGIKYQKTKILPVKK